ncbi:hypothetical protein RND71_020589 [Anisodus tanguticus]|uniref:GBF-interacting protein 1 N-terminal domain-containing protein n=1 Tax=Anisodus tanguticus TaxID=243964 RepID=A0AAE1S2T1_9SOLA|nr:hypothetical protein RND71_020589 [Anisodus tanguticus]
MFDLDIELLGVKFCNDNDIVHNDIKPCMQEMATKKAVNGVNETPTPSIQTEIKEMREHIGVAAGILMSSRGGKNSNNNGGIGIPIGSKKMIHSLKEIVNCPEAEIYAMLKECNMDPNEAVNRLLTQGQF